MRYFITGATGFVGGAVAELLLEEGHELVVLARTPSKASDLDAMGAEIVEGDITDKESMRDAMAGADGVFHIAGWYKVGASDPSMAERINVDGTRNVLELVDELDVEKAVYTSTIAVNSDTGGEAVDETYRFDGQHLSEYDRTKWEAHYEVVEPMVADGVPVVTVMPGAVYGPGDTSSIRRLFVKHLKGALPVVPRKTAFSFGHIEDTARAHLQAMENGTVGEEYIVAGEGYTLLEVFEMAADISGIQAPKPVPPELFTGLAQVNGIVEQFIRLPEMYRSEALRILGGKTYLGDYSKAARELGLEHRPFEEGLSETLEHELELLGDDASRRVDFSPVSAD